MIIICVVMWVLSLAAQYWGIRLTSTSVSKGFYSERWDTRRAFGMSLECASPILAFVAISVCVIWAYANLTPVLLAIASLAWGAVVAISNYYVGKVGWEVGGADWTV
ncbi:MAG: hypothetical protein WCO52_00480 [bacterium]